MNFRLRVSRVVAPLAATIFAAGMLAGITSAGATVSASTGHGSVVSSGQRSASTRSVAAWLARHTSATNGGRPSPSVRARSGHAAPSVPVGNDPFAVLVVPSTGTVYVANIGGTTVSVINAATCNARVSTGCSDTPHSITVGSGPLGEVFDPATQTLYVANLGDNTLSVINAATCNAEVSTGCDQVPKTVAVGSGPTVLALNRATHTLYVANGNVNTLSIINAATCNATVSTSCTATPPTVTVGSGPSGLAIDQATDTVYTANYNDNTASVVNGATCNATDTIGCGQTATAIPIGGSGVGVVIDQPSHTVFVSHFGTSLGGVAMINATTCNGTVTRGCPRTSPATAPAGSAPSWIAENPATRTVYVANEEDSNVTILNAATCNVHDRAGCVSPPPAIGSAFNAGGIDIDVATDTIYYASQSENSLTVLNGAICNAADTRGCTRYAATSTVGTAPQGVVVNPRTDTIYVGNRSDDDLSVINGATCDANNGSGCNHIWPTVAAGPSPQELAVNQTTDTIYASSFDPDTGAGSTVSVIDGVRCNARTTSGCDRRPASVTVGSGPVALTVNQATDTIYVANENDNTVSVIDGATCNATDTSGCTRPPATITVGARPDGVAVDPHTDTVYVSNGSSNTVSVIDGVICNAVIISGCTQTPPTVAVGAAPYGLSIDQHTNTVYVANEGDGTVSVIDAADCNASTSHGCTRIPSTLTTGGIPSAATIDRAGMLFVDSVRASGIDVFNTATCNATTSHGCDQRPHFIPTGGFPAPVAINPDTGTAYAPDNGDGQVSYFSTQRR